MILTDSSSIPLIRRAIPRLGASLALAAGVFGAAQLVHAEGQPSAEIATTVDGSRLPFIICGVDTTLQSGGHQSILLTNAGSPVTPPQIDRTAIGQTFNLHGRAVADCGAGDAFRGLADRAANQGSVSLPAALGWLSGVRAGTTSDQMQALGCTFTPTQGCTMLVPVASGADGTQLQSVMYASMEVSVTGANSHSARLLGDSSALGQ